MCVRRVYRTPEPPWAGQLVLCGCHSRSKLARGQLIFQAEILSVKVISFMNWHVRFTVVLLIKNAWDIYDFIFKNWIFTIPVFNDFSSEIMEEILKLGGGVNFTKENYDLFSLVDQVKVKRVIFGTGYTILFK